MNRTVMLLTTSSQFSSFLYWILPWRGLFSIHTPSNVKYTDVCEWGVLFILLVYVCVFSKRMNVNSTLFLPFNLILYVILYIRWTIYTSYFLNISVYPFTNVGVFKKYGGVYNTPLQYFIIIYILNCRFINFIGSKNIFYI